MSEWNARGLTDAVRHHHFMPRVCVKFALLREEKLNLSPAYDRPRHRPACSPLFFLLAVFERRRLRYQRIKHHIKHTRLLHLLRSHSRKDARAVGADAHRHTCSDAEIQKKKKRCCILSLCAYVFGNN